MCHCPAPTSSGREPESNSDVDAADNGMRIRTQIDGPQNEVPQVPEVAFDQPEARGKRYLTVDDEKHAVCVFEKSYACTDGE